MEFPKLEFKELKGRTEKDLSEFVEAKQADGCWQFLVYIRQKYDFEPEWEYFIAYCSCDIANNFLIWETDWNEGQKAEYLAVCCIP